jgi:hypothetical protein
LPSFLQKFVNKGNRKFYNIGPWFALTSLTPQGGGECPKALSGRILVAAYWLFIVLMLATFTANLVSCIEVLLRFKPGTPTMEEGLVQ